MVTGAKEILKQFKDIAQFKVITLCLWVDLGLAYKQYLSTSNCIEPFVSHQYDLSDS